MKQRKMLSFTLYQLGLLFRQELPGLVAQADASRDAGEFRARLEEFVARHAAAQGEAAEQIRLLIGYDGREVSELSTGEQMPVRTLELLWQFLTGRLENPEMRCDLFIDLFSSSSALRGWSCSRSRRSASVSAAIAGRRGSIPRWWRCAPRTGSVCSTSWCRRSRTASRPHRVSVSRRGCPTRINTVR